MMQKWHPEQKKRSFYYKLHYFFNIIIWFVTLTPTRRRVANTHGNMLLLFRCRDWNKLLAKYYSAYIVKSTIKPSNEKSFFSVDTEGVDENFIKTIVSLWHKSGLKSDTNSQNKPHVLKNARINAFDIRLHKNRFEIWDSKSHRHNIEHYH